MKSFHFKKLTAAMLTSALVLASSTPALAFYNTPESKKGICSSHVDMVSDIQQLGCKQVTFQFNASFLKDEQQMRAFDAMIDQFDAADLTITMGVMNDFQAGDPICPTLTPTANLYQYNTLTPEGIARTQQVAEQLASRYRNRVSNWVIGNEINNTVWNYLGAVDTNTYVKAYADGFRIFYNAIKAQNPDARVFIPFDYNWTQQGGTTMASKTLLELLNTYLSDTDYGIAWHPYPEGLLNPDFLNASPHATESPNTPIINMKNLHVLTDYMQQAPMLSPSGAVRHLILSEEGFNSASAGGEAAQAVAIQQAWQLAQANPYVEAFLLSRLVDAPAELAQGYAFGLYNCDGVSENPTTRKLAWNTYQMCQ